MDDPARTPTSKVARLIAEYELDGIGSELERRWTRAEDRDSLRDLAEEFNRALFRSAMDDQERPILDREVENLYRALTAEDVTSGVRQQARSRIEQRGIDVASLEDDFVSYQSVRTYLKDYRDVSPPDDSPTPAAHRATKRDTIQRLTGRLASVTERSLRELRNASHLTLGSFDVVVTVRVHCTDCETQVPVGDLLDRDGCNCSS